MGTEALGSNPGIPQVTIHVVRGKASTSSREMKGRSLLVGSGPQCDIQMRSPDVAPKHALITRGPEGVVIRQLDTDRPLFVNGTQVTESLISHGDSIKVGPFELSVSIAGAGLAGGQCMKLVRTRCRLLNLPDRKHLLANQSPQNYPRKPVSRMFFAIYPVRYRRLLCRQRLSPNR